MVTRQATEVKVEGNWVEMPYGTRKILFCEEFQVYRCPTPGCLFRSKTPHGVSSHLGRYCPPRPVEGPISVEDAREDEEERRRATGAMLQGSGAEQV